MSFTATAPIGRVSISPKVWCSSSDFNITNIYKLSVSVVLIPSPGLVGRVVDYRSKGMGFELRLDRVTYLVAQSAIVFDLR